MRAIVLLIPLALSGCISLKTFESEPVQLQTPKGEVVCQLYGINQTSHDTAIAWPEAMTEEEADGYCLAEGTRRLPG